MSLYLEKPPSHLHEFFRRSLRTVARRDSGLHAVLAMDGIALTQAMPVYMLSLDQMENDFSLDIAELKGWRSLLVVDGDNGPLRSLDAGYGLGGQEFAFSIGSGPYVDALFNAVVTAEKNFIAAEGQHALRVLEAPGLQFSAIWVERTLTPFLSPRWLPPTPVLEEDQFVSAARSLITKRENAARIPGR